jgi:hypothetical protein
MTPHPPILPLSLLFRLLSKHIMKYLHVFYAFVTEEFPKRKSVKENDVALSDATSKCLK